MLEWSEKIRAVRKKLGLRQSDLARELGVSSVFITKLEKGYDSDGKPVKANVRVLEKLVELGANPDWLFTGEGDILLKKGEKTNGNQLVTVNNLTDSEAIDVISYGQCGPGGLALDLDKTITVPKGFLPKSKGKKLFALEATGRSMVPFIYPGDIVVFREEKKLKNKDIYAVTFEGESMIKRVVLVDNTIILQSYNTEFDPVPISSYVEDELVIHGVAIGLVRSYKLNADRR